MGKIVNVVLNSNNAINAAPLAANNNSLNYFIDWSAILKDGKSYRLHWTYTSQLNTFTIATKLPQLRVDFQMDNYLNKSSTYGAPNTTFIGNLQPKQIVNNTTWSLYADDSNNPPTYLTTRPYNNTFNVQVVTNDAVPTLWVDNAASPVPNNNYILVLSFQEEEEED